MQLSGVFLLPFVKPLTFVDDNADFKLIFIYVLLLNKNRIHPKSTHYYLFGKEDSILCKSIF